LERAAVVPADFPASESRRSNLSPESHPVVTL
jgi:hypothetical protein